MRQETTDFQYDRVAAIIEQQIEAGALRERERVPSLRAMSRHAGVSVGTVVQAYLRLEQRGVLEPRPRSGYFVAPRSAAAVELPERRKVRSRRPLNVKTAIVDTVIESFGR